MVAFFTMLLFFVYLLFCYYCCFFSSFFFFNQNSAEIFFRILNCDYYFSSLWIIILYMYISRKEKNPDK